ncbi:chemotaxis regulatory protein CheY [Posidoniimonas polymericola]|uniref:Chemotaxis regulatory protein CheY n=1 Tax=Posidoniimonas polymericola TaxID=2528002 RepID=A0A5C5YUC8_9BACT|nr:response regulator [Posidoniimonas polymericola]TWT78584.1 chemotaxis regulatory protein CheY [Posidoniimonas polymericola]
MKRILDIGNCGPDHGSLKRFFTGNFDCVLDQADSAADALPKLRDTAYDLVVVNRKLDIDYTDGLDIIRQIKADEQLSSTPVMLITNYPEHQDAAEQAGALRGFGKLELQSSETIERVKSALGE